MSEGLDDAPKDTYRLFFAVSIPQEIRTQLSMDLQDFFGDEGMPGRPVQPANWHLTLRFLGDVPVQNIPTIQEALEAAELDAPFQLKLGGLGAFRHPTSATVLWVNLEDPEEALSGLASKINTALAAAGVPVETRPFVGHLTVSRIRRPQNVSRYMHRFKPGSPAFTVDHVTLYRSHLGQGPARHEVLERYSLV